MQNVPKRAQHFVDRAADMAQAFNFNAVDGPLLIAAIANDETDPAGAAIREFKTVGQCVARAAEIAMQDVRPISAGGKAQPTPSVHAFIVRAQELATAADDAEVEGRHLVLAALESNPDSATWRFLIWCTDRDVLRRRLLAPAAKDAGATATSAEPESIAPATE